MDSHWFNFMQSSDEYARGVEGYLDFAFSTRSQGDQISCPCKECYNRFWHRRDEVYNHLISNGIGSEIKEWRFNEKGMSSMSNTEPDADNCKSNMQDDMESLLYNTHKDIADKFRGYSQEELEDNTNAEAKKFFKLVEDGKQELYPGCKSFSRLSFIIRLYLFKCVHGLSNTGFSDLLEIFQEMVPEAKLPKSFNEANKLVKDLGLHYRKIDACRNDCMLFWKDHENATACHICQAPRWKEVEKELGNNENYQSEHVPRIPAKVVWHFPLKPRLQRLYMYNETSDLMRWHDEKRPRDGKLRHPADGKAWKDFDSLYPQFAQESRNVRLGLASDGFNPFRTMSTTHSTWPVVLVNYNLPPWLIMKPEFLILSLIIPGPHSPGNDIDVYLQIVVDELNELCDIGVDTYDVSKCQTFRMHAFLLSTTSDFPGYAMLSGFSTKGKYACPHCHYDTEHMYLNKSRKSCYMGGRRFLEPDHPWRNDKKSFNGEIEEREAPKPLTGTEVLYLLEDFENKFGKMQPKVKFESCPWRKKSCFFTLPYWKDIACRHHLDPMHIEKNITDSVLGTLLDIPGKTKDHYMARLDLKEMGIRKSLHPVECANKRYLLPKACFSRTKEEKQLFCTVLKNAKLPQGCSSNIARCVQMKELKVSGYKSHDAHIMMQYLITVAVRKSLPKQVALALIRLGAFFKGICKKVIDPKDLDPLQDEIVEILCIFEKIFPPSFFDIMMHLPIHLVGEIKLSGPVNFWWMYGIERYLGKLKKYVRNRSRPEASIAEGYLAEECLVFCSRYLNDGEKKRSKSSRESYGAGFSCDDKSPIFPKSGHPLGRKKKNKKGKAFSLEPTTKNIAHRYVLFNCEDEQVQRYQEEHESMMKVMSKDKDRKRWREAQQHSGEFMEWLKERVKSDQLNNHIKWLSLGPCNVARKYVGYCINGYKFYTRERDAKCKSQNSGVSLLSLTSSFASKKDRNPVIGEVACYGVIQEIIELDYWSCFSVVLFKCDWFHVEKDDYGLTRVNFNKHEYSNDPFVLASQVQQVFYTADCTEKGIHYATEGFPKEFFNVDQTEETFLMEPNESHENRMATMTGDNDDIMLCREGVPHSVVDEPDEGHATQCDQDDTILS